MGLLDKLKSMKNAITGGGATVRLEVGSAVRGTPFPVRVMATVGDADLKIDNVYVNIDGLETTEMDVEVEAKDEKQTIRKNIEKKLKEASTYHQEVVLAGAQTLNAKHEYVWEGTIQLPASALVTYKGVNARHEWRILGALSVTGNDPDSGWVTIEVQ